MKKKKKKRKRLLSEKGVRSLRPNADGTELHVTDAQVPGLSLRVLPSGRKFWRYVYRSPELPVPDKKTGKLHGRVRSMSIGEYLPDRKDGWSLKRARAEAMKLRHQVKILGIDPQEQKARERREAARERADTVGRLAERYVEEYASRKADAGYEDARYLDVEVLPRWADEPIGSITRQMVRDLVADKARDAPTSANRLLAVLSKMFAWAVQEELLDRSPAAGIERPGEEVSRERTLTEAEVRELWRLSGGMRPSLRAYWRLALLTGQRRGELRWATWEELDLDRGLWTIPWRRRKGRGFSRRDHVLPLGPLALAALPDPVAGNPYVLAGAKRHGGEERPVGETTVNRSKPPFPDFRGAHDLRNNLMTWVQELVAFGNGYFAAERIAGHALPKGATRGYIHSDFLEEKREGLAAVEAHVRAILEGSPPGRGRIRAVSPPFPVT